MFKDLASSGPSTAEAVASRTRCHPRYVDEWLHAMHAAGYIIYDSQTARFEIPAAHAPVLAEEGGEWFAGGTHQMLLGMLSAIEPLHSAFRTGAGIPMSAYSDDTWEGMERDMAGVYQTRLVAHWYALSILYCLSTSLAAGGEGLGTMGLSPSKMFEFCERAGFAGIRQVPLENSVHNLYEAVR